ncbi:CgeB family protein [Fictibacillus fluitans]|uniref:Glycosyltransferase n=1 Tax=Fictibacillus fluitans TaxID=3058422 RepID=A0ABT8HS65_9BACL|nr:glycosyltransferase [Fictibacillus sp. NE201]MDN4523618.1 glycosyltransferase [Fictibacillus sp. NE201]
MNILYIPSGFPRIYFYIDNNIVNQIKAAGHICTVFSHFKGMDALRLIINRFKPDLVLTSVSFLLPSEMAVYIKSQKIPSAVWLTEDPFYMDSTLKLAEHYDYLFTIEKSAIPYYFEKGHHQTYYLPLGTDPATFTSFDVKKMYDVCLIGFPYPDRIELINHITRESDLSLLLVGDEWMDILNNEQKQRVTIKTWTLPENAAKCYQQAHIALNPQRPHQLEINENSVQVPANSVNNRTFDLAACGVFQLLSSKKVLPLHMTENEELVFYENKEDCLNKIQFYLTHPHEAMAIAEKAKATVLKFHTFKHRIQEMLRIIQENHA